MSPPEKPLSDQCLPLEIAEPNVFAQPWQAQVFALVISLHERDVFSWNEWADALSGELKSTGASRDGSDYYDCWLRALERLLIGKNIATGRDVDALAASWSRAAHATPHGQPICLENDPEPA